MQLTSLESKTRLIFSGEAYRYFVNSARSMTTKNAYTKALRVYMKFKRLTDYEQLLTGELKLIQIPHYRVADSP